MECILGENKSITVSRGMWTTCGDGNRKLNRALGMHAVTEANIRMADGRVVVTLERQPSVHTEKRLKRGGCSRYRHINDCR